MDTSLLMLDRYSRSFVLIRGMVAGRSSRSPLFPLELFSEGRTMTNWQQNLLDSSEQIRELLLNTKRIAVLGIKTERQAGQPAFYVPEYLAAVGFEIIPVPVYYPEVTEILGQKVYRRLADIPVEVDLVNIFRRSQDIDQHVEDIITKAPKAVWLQSGI